MKKRIYGLETEYGIALVRKDGSWDCCPTVLSPYQYSFEVATTRAKKEFLANGSRIYLDLAFHPEYATAECADLTDLVAQDKAGERLLRKIFAQIAEERENGENKIALFKNNSQYASEGDFDESCPVTMGCHENFLTMKELTEETLAAALVPFLVARQVFSGSGWVANSSHQARGIRYAISQRSRFIHEVIGESTSAGRSRAILCTARWNEPHADAAIYRRLHLILGDSNMSEVSTYLKVGTIGILLEMLEEGYPLAQRSQKFFPRYSVDALHLVSRDLSCKKPTIELLDGRFISAIDMLWEYVDIMSEYESSQGLSPELSDVLKRLIDGLQRLEKREIDKETLMEIDSQGLDEEWDWLIKKSILDATLHSFGCHWNNFYGKKIDFNGGELSLYEKIISNDLKYHSISEGGLYNDFVARPDLPPSRLKMLRIRTPRIVEKEKIAYMEKNPPQNTRAKIRGEFVKFLLSVGKHSSFFISWDTIYPLAGGYSPFPIIKLLNPLAIEDERIDLLKSLMEQQGGSSRPS